MSNKTVGAGIILRKTTKLKAEQSPAKKEIVHKRGAVLWLTGLSGSGKSTLADKLAIYLKNKNIAYERLDGDILRQNLSKDLGFSKKDRDENIKRAVYIARLLSRNGIIVLATFISPFKKQREMVRKQVDNFVEVFVNAPLEVCEKRDAKGMYKKARQGKIKDFTGVSQKYEKPLKPDVELETDKLSVDECVGKVIKYLERRRLI